MLALVAIFPTHHAAAQSVVTFGKGSMASEPPNYNFTEATRMLTRTLYVDELPERQEDGLTVPGRPIPTNDWWTDLINSPFSGALWSYPAMLNTSADGVEICWPTYWADAGKEIKSRSSVAVGGTGYRAEAAIASDWHDWDVCFRMPSDDGEGSVEVRAAHGMPFTWFRYDGVRPEASFNSRAVDNAVTTAIPAGTVPEIFGVAPGRLGADYGGDIYGFYFPATSSYELDGKTLRFSEGSEWLVVALLGSREELAQYDTYAVSMPTSTRVEWSYDEPTARIATSWSVEATNLRDSSAPVAVLQGFLPHVWKHALPGATIAWTGRSYLTPRGEMRMASSTSGTFAYSYRFAGMLPTYAAPRADDSAEHPFSQDILNELMERYATDGTFGGDTYWGGKGLTQMALNMSFARQTGNGEVYEISKRKLREAFVDWLTYTPGEGNGYLAYYRRWGGILGYDVSYGSETFNDHHFHFGYFAYAAALLCMEDPDFAGQYGDILRLIVKDYANWDRNDARFPFLRTLDPWCGHSWAGGLGDGGNDNGNGQESTSESMQAWGGVYLLGVALGDREMRDAGIFGWSTEARATREYWYDVDSPRPANAGGRKPWPGKGERKGQYDYSLYPYAYNSNITGKGIGWWTWFGGDPLYMHGIQWMPISPALDYLSWDTDFVAWAFDDMMSGANSTYSHAWFEDTSNTADGSTIEALAKHDWGNVALSYLQRADPAEAARIFDEAYRRDMHLAKSVSTAHISYYTLHNTLTYGVPSTDYHADCPTAVVFVKDGKPTYMVYNPGTEDLTVNFFDAAGTKVKTVIAAPGRLTAFDRGEPEATAVELGLAEGGIIPPGGSSAINARVLDQYGAGLPGASVALSVSDPAIASVQNNTLKIAGAARRGAVFSLTAASGSLTATAEVTVNDKPRASSARIVGLDGEEMLVNELGTELLMALEYTDQYGHTHRPADVEWTYATTEGDSGTAEAAFTPSRPGVYTITAVSAEGGARAQGTVFVTPPLGSVSAGATAVSSSEENAGTLTAGAIDGLADGSHRWGSRHSDGEWIYVDLGADCFVSRVGIVWDPAYASEYEIQLAPDGCAMSSHTGQYAAGTLSVPVPAESAWTSSVTQTIGQRTEAEVMTRVNATGRYVRMKGIRRGSVYGFSIWEMTVYGIPSDMAPDDILGTDFALPQDMTEGETVRLEPTVYRRDGSVAEGVMPAWSADKEAEFGADGAFTPLSHGLYTVTGTLDGGKSSSASVFVYELVRLQALELSASELELVEGESVRIDFTALDQFGCEYRLDDGDVDVRVIDGAGQDAAGRAVYSTATRRLAAIAPGDYTAIFSAQGQEARAQVHVKAISESNLALGKAVRASSFEGGFTPDKLTDGITAGGSRWASLWEPDQWAVVDLGRPYKVNRMNIYWESAYALRYSIDASLDGLEWNTIHTENDSPGGLEHIELPADVPARYLRLNCIERKLPAYGFSAYEWEVYGSGRHDDGGSSSADLVEAGSGDADCWYTLRGIPVEKPSAGIYIRVREGHASLLHLP